MKCKNLVLISIRQFIILMLLFPTLFAQYQTQEKMIGSKYYQNPVFSGDYPDPSILRDGDDYYLVTSSFDYYPGLVIWHSTDLINWEPVTAALKKFIGTVWAPDLVKYKDKYYIYIPVPQHNTNFVVWANDIKGPWSDPVDLKFPNIDPGHVVDDDGNRYLYFSSGGYVQLAEDGLSVVGEFHHSYNGWEIPRDWSIELFALEGPKLTKRGVYYYLTVAEGGTAGPATGHMVISARSKSPLGPWENSPYNPIEKAYSKDERWWSKGHATLFDDTNGNWWILFHGYEKDYGNMGRQILMEPVEWTEDDWFRVSQKIKTDKPIKRPYKAGKISTFTLSDDFRGPELKPTWQFFGEYGTSRFHFVENGLAIKGKGNKNHAGGSSPLLCIPSHHSYTAEVEMTIEGNAVGGLMLFYNDNYHSGILADSKDILANMRGWQFVTEKDASAKHVFLKLKNIENTVDMYYSLDGKTWTKIQSSVEVSGFNHNALSGFISLRLGLCSLGDGTVTFKNFKYEPIK